MKKRLIVVAAIALVLAALATYLLVPGSVPRDQRPLVKLTATNLAQFQTAFDAADSMPRVVLLLSPT
jgi:hypothetical protein